MLFPLQTIISNELLLSLFYSTGPPGSIGPVGLKGNSGPVGAPGIDGFSGRDGEKGDRGFDGKLESKIITHFGIFIK